MARTLPSKMKFAEAIVALLFNQNGWANASLVQFLIVDI